MKNIMRLSLPKYTNEQINTLVEQAISVITNLTNPYKIILFGSAVTDSFDSASDLDFVIIYDSISQAKEAQKTLYRQTHLFPCRVDLLCIDSAGFTQKANQGGVMQIALEDGRLVYSREL